MKRLSVWEFSAMLNGYAAARGGGDQRLSEAEADALFEWIDSGEVPGTGQEWRYTAAFGPRGLWVDGVTITAAAPPRPG